MQADDTMHVTAMHDLEPRHDMYKITSGDSALGINNGIINSDKGLAATATNQVLIITVIALYASFLTLKPNVLDSDYGDTPDTL